MDWGWKNLNNKLYVGNLDWGVSEEELREFFTSSGEVKKVQIILDRNTGRSRGFGFVEMATEEEAKHAIELLNNTIFASREVRVREARPQPERNAPRPNVDRCSPVEDLVGKPEEKSDFIKSIEEFVKKASTGEELGFISNDKHFTICRDNPFPAQPVGNSS